MQVAAGTLAERYNAIRSRTASLAAPLSAEECCIQSMPDASPVKWHLAHTTWFFETFVLTAHEPHYRAFDPAFLTLFNSYYHGVGAMHPRPRRGQIGRPGLIEILAYRQAVDERILRLLQGEALDDDLLALCELGLQHEQQHQELILTDLKHLLAQNPLLPAYLAAAPPAPRNQAAPLVWHEFPAGMAEIGDAGKGFAFDNEGPRHRQFLASFALASRPVSNAEYADFIADGAYRQPLLWLSEGFDWLYAERGQPREHPLYWRRREDAWDEFTLHGLQALDPAAPVCHLSYYEADAYARWCGARLPTEFEWELAGQARPLSGNFADNGLLQPRAADGEGLQQMYGDVWEWTQSAYSPYPGYRPATGSLGEYNGKFMVNQYVLRGGSCATPAGHIRASYRNFFPTSACWQFSGLRLARDRS